MISKRMITERMEEGRKTEKRLEEVSTKEDNIDEHCKN